MQTQIQGITCTVAHQQWMELLRRAFPEFAPRASYITVNNLGQLFNSTPAELQPNQSTLRVSCIIATSRLVFASYRNCSDNEIRDLREIYTKMIPRASNSWCSMFIHLMLGFGFRTTLDLIAQELVALEISVSTRRIHQTITTELVTFQSNLTTMETVAQRIHDERFINVYRTYLEAFNAWSTRFENFFQNTFEECRHIEAGLQDMHRVINGSIALFNRLYNLAVRNVALSENLTHSDTNNSDSHEIGDQDHTQTLLDIETGMVDFVESLFANGNLNLGHETETLDRFERQLTTLEERLPPSNPPPHLETSSTQTFRQSPFRRSVNPSRLAPMDDQNPTRRSLNFNSGE
jgi:hypothetical protein